MFWDRVAGVYDIAMKLKNGRVNRLFCAQVAELIQPADTVLECACGTGMISVCIAPRCRTLVATDFSDGMLVQTRKKCRRFANVRVEKSNILRLQYPDDSFDKVVAGNVIHLLDAPEQAFAELMRVCRPGGLLILPTYVNRERTGRSSLFVRAADRFGANFQHQFSFPAYQDYIRKLSGQEADFSLVEGAMPCAVAVLRKPE